MEPVNVTSVDQVTLNRRGYCIVGKLLLSLHHLVFSFDVNGTNKEIWIAYPIIERIHKTRGSSWMSTNAGGAISGSTRNGSPGPNGTSDECLTPPKLDIKDFDHYSASHIRLQCKDFTYYSFDFVNDVICMEAFIKLSSLITKPKLSNDKHSFYAFDYNPNLLEQKLPVKGWNLFDPVEEYKRLGLIQSNDDYWRISSINHDYKFCPSYPNILIVPATVSDNVLKHAAKFRSKQRIPAIVYRHNGNPNRNIIARCAQPLVGLNILNRSIQDEKLIGEVFKSQERERDDTVDDDYDLQCQPQKNLIVDLRPVTNALAQHALGAGTENIENYRGKPQDKDESSAPAGKNCRQVDKIFGNIDNIHVMRDSLNKLSAILNDLDKYPNPSSNKSHTGLQHSLTKTQWLNRLSIVLQSVDRIVKSIHLNNTNVVIHCSDGWDRTSQVSALAQLCLDPYYRTTKGFMVLIEKEWISFGFKFNTRADHGGCIGALTKRNKHNETEIGASESTESLVSTESSEVSTLAGSPINGTSSFSATSNKAKVAHFFQRAANHVKNAATNASSTLADNDITDSAKFLTHSVYGGSSERSPIFHQFLDCVYQILRQHPDQFEFNSRFLKRLFYHYYSCQYGTFLCDSELELKGQYKLNEATVSAWDYFLSRPFEFTNKQYRVGDPVIFFNFIDIKWWVELYGRSDEEMNGLSNSLEKKFAQMNVKSSQ